jgi:hypothetical protein
MPAWHRAIWGCTLWWTIFIRSSTPRSSMSFTANSNAISWSPNVLGCFFGTIRGNIWKRSAGIFQNTCLAFYRLASGDAKPQTPVLGYIADPPRRTRTNFLSRSTLRSTAHRSRVSVWPGRDFAGPPCQFQTASWRRRIGAQTQSRRPSRRHNVRLAWCLPFVSSYRRGLIRSNGETDRYR